MCRVGLTGCVLEGEYSTTVITTRQRLYSPAPVDALQRATYRLDRKEVAQAVHIRGMRAWKGE